MKKIAIISELNLSNINYGNRLQAYALNEYLSEKYEEFNVYSLILKRKQKYKITKFSLKHNLAIYLIPLLTQKKERELNRTFKNRMNLCNNFTINNTKYLNKEFGWRDINKANFDIYIVGSDIVWNQDLYLVNRFKFLDFKTKKEIKKISYAASFGRDFIPENNKKIIKKLLSSFDGISVRENSSIKMLNNLGIDNVVNTCDPTLLLTKQKWMSVEKNPNLTSKKFIFVYLLGKSKRQREFIIKFAEERNLIIINIPNANGIIDSSDEKFGNIQFDNCSPENWIWLIHHAEYIFTDSFHGVIFSSIFEKKFFALKREAKVDINNRINDYLKRINQEDKLISCNESDISS